MSIHGTLKTMNVSDLLQFLAAGRKTGTLKIGRGSIVKQIFFEQGLIVGSSSNDPKERVGQVLLHYGKIAEDQLQLGMQLHSQTGVRLGTVLIESGFVSEKDILEVLRTRTLEIIYELFIWDEGEFEFIESEALPDDLIRVAVDATSVIMEGIYRIDEWSRYRKVIGSDRTFFELDEAWAKWIVESSEIREVLFFVEKRMTAAEICYNMHTSLFHASAILFDLVEKGAIKVAGETPEPEAAAEPEVLQPTSPIHELLALANVEINENNPEKALKIIHGVLDREAHNAEAHTLRERAEKEFIASVYASGLSPNAICEISLSLNQLEHQGLNPQEGFVLSRINGELDVASILSVCPFREADTLRMIKKLLDGGVLRVK